MIVLEQFKKTIDTPEGFNLLKRVEKDYVYDRLYKGLLVFVMPDRYDSEEDKNILNAYKTGFLNELLTVVYGEEYTTKKRYDILNKKFSMFFTYRTFFNHLNFYEKNIKQCTYLS